MTADLIDRMMAYECGELDAADTLALFAALVADGSAWQLQGHYGRTARALIDAGLITEDGEITRTGYMI